MNDVQWRYLAKLPRTRWFTAVNAPLTLRNVEWACDRLVTLGRLLVREKGGRKEWRMTEQSIKEIRAAEAAAKAEE